MASDQRAIPEVFWVFFFQVMWPVAGSCPAEWESDGFFCLFLWLHLRRSEGEDNKVNHSDSHLVAVLLNRCQCVSSSAPPSPSDGEHIKQNSVMICIYWWGEKQWPSTLTALTSSILMTTTLAFLGNGCFLHVSSKIQEKKKRCFFVLWGGGGWGGLYEPVLNFCTVS